METGQLGTLGLIAARGGSKALPRKNILDLAGKPLIAWTIEAALASTAIDSVVLSSDDDEIISIAEKWGCDVPFKRPDHLASDTSSSMDVILHALDILSNFSHVVLLQPTSPLRTAADIDSAYQLMLERNAKSCVSLREVFESPYLMHHLGDDAFIESVLSEPFTATRRQDMPDIYSLNGAIYISDVAWLQKTESFISSQTVGYVMSSENSIDIDDIHDFEQASHALAARTR